MLIYRGKLGLVALLLVSTACVPQTLDSVTPSPTPTAALEPESPIAQAKADLTERLGADVSDIEVVSAEAQVWPDGSLGCPQPGMSYIQIMVEGYRILLRYAGKTYDYRAGPSSPILCELSVSVEKPTPAPGATIPQPPSAQNASDTFLIYGVRQMSDVTPSGAGLPGQYPSDVMKAAASDLADRLGVAVEAVSVVQSGYVEAPAAAPCGMTPKSESGAIAGGLSMGYEVVLRAGGAQYRYVAVGGLGHFCGGS